MTCKIVTWLRVQATGPMTRNPEHIETCQWLSKAADEIMRLREADRLRSEDDETSETEWRSLVYVLVDAVGLTRGTSIPEDVAHTKAAIERLQEEIDCLPIEENERLREALTPSADTKAAYIGEVSCDLMGDGFDELTVPWTAIKETMAMIRKRAEAAREAKE